MKIKSRWKPNNMYSWGYRQEDSTSRISNEKSSVLGGAGGKASRRRVVGSVEGVRYEDGGGGHWGRFF